MIAPQFQNISTAMLSSEGAVTPGISTPPSPTRGERDAFSSTSNNPPTQTQNLQINPNTSTNEKAKKNTPGRVSKVMGDLYLLVGRVDLASRLYSFPHVVL